MRTLQLGIVALLALAGQSKLFSQQAGELPLRSGDRIQIAIGAVPDSDATQVRGDYTISDNGTISLPHIGDVHAAGLKPSSLQRAIQQMFIAREIYSHPNVLVSIDTREDPRVIYVTGVQKPGPVPYTQGMTLSQVIQFAGGRSHFGNLKKTQLIRNSRTTVHNLKDHTGDPKVDVLVQPKDQIIVPE